MADSTAVAVEVLPLLGVAVGSGTTLLGQWMTARSSTQKDRAVLQRQDRQERKMAIMALLDATQCIEEHLDRMRDGVPADRRETDHDLHAMWLAVKEVVITCTPATARAADAYCTELNGQARSSTVDASPKRLARQTLLTEAKQELRISEP